MPRAHRLRSLALVAALAIVPPLLAGCASPTAAPAMPERLAVSIRQGRLDVPAGRLVVRFENHGPTPVTIESFIVESPTLESGLERSEPIELDADDAVDIRLDLTASVCDAAPGPVEVDLVLRTADGTTEGRLTADDPFDTVARANGADCLGESVAAVAALVMPEHLRSTGAGPDRRAFIDVRFEPVPGTHGSMRIERVYGTTLLNAEDGIDWTLGLDVAAGDAPFTISLPVRPARCDAHAIADDKRGTILPFEVATDDGRAGRLDVPADNGLKAELYAYYGERCGLDAPAG
ncbi:hypothetical protein [Agromyces bauzanensis]|uniref:Lipoprotein n=1 Tax=Agromyces bauzanensis TaxID=1308924 RepID=A0A917UM16_9MICO|nr:hypothetical protein [Agromyces bauzanensis]GGJ67401.1 hypothetical protein GCM10011372_01490 [Agromyces bauzanensis]